MSKSTSVLVALALAFPLSTAAYATPEHLYTGGFNKATTVPGINLKWTSPTSAYYQTTYVVPAANSWNNISTQVKLTQSTTTTDKITVRTGRTTQTGLVGQMVPYCTNMSFPTSGNLCLSNTKWTNAEITSFTDQQVASQFTPAEIRSTIAHEFGHALSLKHVEASYPAPALMKQGTQDIKPTSVDKGHLKEKWGN